MKHFIRTLIPFFLLPVFFSCTDSNNRVFKGEQRPATAPAQTVLADYTLFNIDLSKYSLDKFENLDVFGRLKLFRQLYADLAKMLPDKGDPYKDLMLFGIQELDKTISQLEDDPVREKFRDEMRWLPRSGQEFFELVGYNVAVFEVLFRSSYFLQGQVIVESPLQSLGSKRYELFTQGERLFFTYFNDNYQKPFKNNPVLTSLLNNKHNRALVKMAAYLAYGAEEYLEIAIPDYTQRTVVARALDELGKIEKKLDSDPTMTNRQIRAEIKQFKGTSIVQTTAEILHSVDLPDSGEIDGLDHSFVAVMRTQIGFQIISSYLFHDQNLRGGQ